MKEILEMKRIHEKMVKRRKDKLKEMEMADKSQVQQAEKNTTVR